MRDLTGMQFGKLTVDKYVGKNRWSDSVWRCYCSCYECPFVKISSANLLSGKTKSCGCLKRNQYIKSKVKTIKKGFHEYGQDDEE